MTLAGIAYGAPPDIPSYLAQDALTQGDWTISWIAQNQDVPVNFAFIAQSKTSGAYCIAIRGTYPNPLNPAYWDDGSQDNPLGTMQPWPIGAGPGDGAMVSAGTAAAFGNIIALSNGTTTFQQALEAIPAGAKVTVTGHSLGGTLAPVIALWMTGLPNGLVPDVYCYAGMTPGNNAFANLFGPGTALDGKVTRYANTLDSVPYGWNDVLSTRGFYDPAPKGGMVYEAAIIGYAAALADYGYAPIGEEVTLEGQLFPSQIACDIVAFVIQNLRQHLPDTYLSLLGAPPLPFTLGFGSVVLPGGHPTISQLASNRLPVYYL